MHLLGGGEDKLTNYYSCLSKYEKSAKIAKNDYERYIKIVYLLRECNLDCNVKIMDIGCSVGHLLNVLKENGYKNVMGLDPSPKCKILAKKYFGIDVVTGKIGDKINQTYDVIILEMVLEHIMDLNSAIQFIASLLTSNGIVYVGVPNAEKFVDTSENLYQEFSCEHVNFFTSQSLNNLMYKNGFDLIRVQKDTELFSVYRKTNRLFSFINDSNAKNKIYDYITKCKCLQKQVERKLLKYVGRKVYIWGTGTHTAFMLDKMNLDRFTILAYVDSNEHYWDKYIGNIKIINPLQEKFDGNAAILISSQWAQNEIEKYIKEELKMSNEIIKLYKNG